jgi:hypothetical protein
VDEESLGHLQGTLIAVWKIICSIFWRGERTRKFTVTAEKGYTYSLKEPKTFFATLLEDEQSSSPSLRELLEKWHDDGLQPVMIVGCRTLVDAKLVQADKSVLAISASGQVAGGGGNVSNDPAGAHIQAGHEHKTGECLTLRMDGERVFAIRYRAINTGYVGNEMVASLELSNPNTWRIFPQTRGRPAENAEVMEALLEESDYTVEGELFLNGDEETFVKLVGDEED